jgi:hypothetical protein
MANRQPLTEATTAPERAEPAISIDSVARDFVALVAILDRQLELIPASDHETRAHIAHAKTAAQHGAQLSRKLLNQMDSNV